MQIFRCLAILRRDNSTGSWVFFIWLSFLPPFSLTAVLPPCEIKKEKKKKAITQHITMPWSRWETMPHTCTVSNSFGLAFFKSISHYFCWRNPLEHPCGHWRNSSKNLLASKQLLFGFLFSSVFLASLPLELKNGSRGEVQIPAVHFSTNGCVQMAWREEAFDWGTKRHLWTTKSNSRKCTDTQKRIHTHSCAPYCSPSLGR